MRVRKHDNPLLLLHLPRFCLEDRPPGFGHASHPFANVNDFFRLLSRSYDSSICSLSPQLPLKSLLLVNLQASSNQQWNPHRHLGLSEGFSQHCTGR
jgi:hypothetical protein